MVDIDRVPRFVERAIAGPHRAQTSFWQVHANLVGFLNLPHSKYLQGYCSSPNHIRTGIALRHISKRASKTSGDRQEFIAIVLKFRMINSNGALGE